MVIDLPECFLKNSTYAVAIVPEKLFLYRICSPCKNGDFRKPKGICLKTDKSRFTVQNIGILNVEIHSS